MGYIYGVFSISYLFVYFILKHFLSSNGSPLKKRTGENGWNFRKILRQFIVSYLLESLPTLFLVWRGASVAAVAAQRRVIHSIVRIDTNLDIYVYAHVSWSLLTRRFATRTNVNSYIIELSITRMIR